MNPIVREIAERAADFLNVPAARVEGVLAPPRDESLGDYTIPCFAFAKELRRSPQEIAAELAPALEQLPSVERAEAAGPYVNLTVDRPRLLRHILGTVLKEGERYGGSDEGQGKTIVIDYSSPNIARPFTIAHMRTTVLGHSLKKIYEHLGYRVIGVNHLGDWGTQFGALIAAYKRWGSRERVEKDNVYELFRLYVRFHEEAKKDPALEDEGRAWFKRLEEGDPEALELWQWFVDVSWRVFQHYYEILGIEFEEVRGESAYRDMTGPLIQELLEKGIAKESRGAVIVPLDEEGDEGKEEPPLLLRKSDGTTLYATRDLAAAIYHYEKYQFHKKLYVVDAGQSLHFKQLFKALEKMGYPWAKDLVHVAFGVVLIEEQRMSTRAGRVVFFEDVLKQAVERIRRIIEEAEKKTELSDEEKEQVAQDVGVGAIVYANLSRSRLQNINFRWDEVLSFEGRSGPYLQYTHARLAGVLRKYEGEIPQDPDYSALTQPQEVALAKKLEQFPARVQAAAQEYDPFLLSDYLYDLALAINKFYDSCRVLGEPPEIERARIALVGAAKTVLKKGLELLGLKAPEKM